jgi:hypothetical protein
LFRRDAAEQLDSIQFDLHAAAATVASLAAGQLSVHVGG